MVSPGIGAGVEGRVQNERHPLVHGEFLKRWSNRGETGALLCLQRSESPDRSGRDGSNDNVSRNLMIVVPVLSRAARHALMSTQSNREEAVRPSVRQVSETRDGDMETRSGWGENAAQRTNGCHQAKPIDIVYMRVSSTSMLPNVTAQVVNPRIVGVKPGS